MLQLNISNSVVAIQKTNDHRIVCIKIFTVRVETRTLIIHLDSILHVYAPSDIFCHYYWRQRQLVCSLHDTKREINSQVSTTLVTSLACSYDWSIYIWNAPEKKKKYVVQICTYNVVRVNKLDQSRTILMQYMHTQLHT
jgi:hypothetical protein